MILIWAIVLRWNSHCDILDYETVQPVVSVPSVLRDITSTSTFRTTLPVTQFKTRRQHFAHNFLYPHITVYVAMTRRLEYGQLELMGRTHRALLLTCPVTRNRLQPIRMSVAESSFMTHYGPTKGQSSMELNTLEY